MVELSLDLQAERAAFLSPIFNTLTRQGRKRAWLAHELGISKTRLWNWEHGAKRPPNWIFERAYAALGIPAEMISVSPELLARMTWTPKTDKPSKRTRRRSASQEATHAPSTTPTPRARPSTRSPHVSTQSRSRRNPANTSQRAKATPATPGAAQR